MKDVKEQDPSIANDISEMLKKASSAQDFRNSLLIKGLELLDYVENLDIGHLNSMNKADILADSMKAKEADVFAQVSEMMNEATGKPRYTNDSSRQAAAKSILDESEVYQKIRSSYLAETTSTKVFGAKIKVNEARVALIKSFLRSVAD